MNSMEKFQLKFVTLRLCHSLILMQIVLREMAKCQKLTAPAAKCASWAMKHNNPILVVPYSNRINKHGNQVRVQIQSQLPIFKVQDGIYIGQLTVEADVCE